MRSPWEVIAAMMFEDAIDTVINTVEYDDKN